MNLINIGKWCTVLIAILQAVLSYCNGTFTMASIMTIISALVAAGILHTGTVTLKKDLLKKGIKLLIIMTLVPVLMFGSVGCAAVTAVAAAGGAGGVAYGVFRILSSLPWAAKICYLVGDQGALKIMPLAPKAVDQGVIDATALGISYLKTANGVPANQVNQYLANTLMNLPPDTVVEFQNDAQTLDQFLPPADSTTALTSDQINDIIAFLQGWQDGTKTVMSGTSAAKIEREIQAAQSKKFQIESEHRASLPTNPAKGGWFVPVIPAAEKK